VVTAAFTHYQRRLIAFFPVERENAAGRAACEITAGLVAGAFLAKDVDADSAVFVCVFTRFV